MIFVIHTFDKEEPITRIYKEFLHTHKRKTALLLMVKRHGHFTMRLGSEFY